MHGYAVGVGVTTILPFDFRIAGESAQFGFSFVKMGLLPEAASTTLLPRLVGMGPALDWCLTGRFVGAAEARETGLVRDVAPTMSWSTARWRSARSWRRTRRRSCSA